MPKHRTDRSADYTKGNTNSSRLERREMSGRFSVEASGLDGWIEQAKASSIDELRRFAAGLLRDRAAVTAALTLSWSNGQVEGQVHRLKMLKRQMYGRAKFDLLRARVLPPP